MPSKHATGTRSTVIRCPNCGEDYSVTYKRCPFCDEKTAPPRRRSEGREDACEEAYDEGAEGRERRPRQGRRVSGGARGGGSDWSPLRIGLTVLSLAVIVAAVLIVVTQIVPLVRRSENLNKDPNATQPAATQDVAPSPAPTGTASPGATGAPDATQPPEATTTPALPPDQTATGFTLNKSDFSMSDRYPEPIQLKVTFTPAGTTGAITWESSDPEVAAVDETGKVTRGTKSGQTTITATMAGGFQQECIVRGNYASGGATTNADAGGASAGSLSLNRTDFTLYKAGESFTMRVSGTSSTPTWSIANASVATISGDGTVTAVGSGTTTVTCTVDGQKLECIVRVSIQ